jgi:DNA end-binding protein Ku
LGYGNCQRSLPVLVPVDKLDPVYSESSYYLAPSKGAEKPYRLLAETLEKTGRVALA